MKKLLLTVLLLLGLSTPAWATRYWVDPSGSDANVCADIDGDVDPGVYKASPFSAQSCLTVAGDRMTIKAGTYTGTTARITTFESGTAGNPTIIEGDPGDADGCALAETCSTILQPTGNGNNTFLNGPSYFTIRKLDLNNINIPRYYPLRIETGTNWLIEDVEAHGTRGAFDSSSCIISGYSASSGTFRRVHAHHCGDTVGNTDHGGYLQGDDLIIEDSAFHDNVRNGVQCYTAVALSDNRADRCTVRRSTFYDNGNIGLVLEGNDDQAYDNVFYGNGGDGVQIGYTGALRTLFQNNLVYNNATVGVHVGVSGPASDSVLKNNIITGNGGAEVTVEAGTTNVTRTYNACTAAEGTECATANKLTIAAVTTCTVSASDFHHNATSTCIGAGTSVTTRSPNGTTDIGPYEAFGFSSATINENYLDVTLGMNANVPVTVALTGWATNNGRTVTAASRLAGADSIVRLTISGAACAGESWTVTATSSSATDSRGQPITAFAAQAVTNNCGTPPPAGPGTPLIIYEMDEGTGTVLDNTGSSGATDDGALTGTTAWGTGKAGSGVTLTDATNGDLGIPYGNAVNPSTQSLTVAFWVNIPSGIIGAERYYFGGTTLGTNQRFYISTLSGTWRLGIQASNNGTASNLSVVEGWNRVCLTADSGTDTATLTVNGVVGTTGAAKTYTSFTLPSDLQLGSHSQVYTPGATFDKFKLWETAEDCADDWAAENPAPPAATGTFTDKAFRFYQAHYATGTTTLVPMAAVSTAVSVPIGESFALVKQTDCTAADCTATAHRLRYSRNGGAFTEIPDNCDNADQICFIGAAIDATVVQGTITCCLTGALTPLDGVWNHTAAATPLFDLPQNGSTVHGFVVKLGVSAVETDTYDLKLYDQTGAALDVYDPAGGARVTVSGGIGAPTGLRFSGPASNTDTTLLWTPVAHATLGGYHVYRSLTSTVYDSTPTYTVSVAGAMTSRGPVTQIHLRLPVADTYYFKVSAFDLDGNESAASSEVNITMTGQSARTAR